MNGNTASAMRRGFRARSPATISSCLATHPSYSPLAATTVGSFFGMARLFFSSFIGAVALRAARQTAIYFLLLNAPANGGFPAGLEGREGYPDCASARPPPARAR